MSDDRRGSERRLGRVALVTVAVLAVAWLALVLLVRPSNDRDWSPDMVRLPAAEFHGDSVTVTNVRNNLYRSVDDFDVRWEDRRYDLQRLESVWFVVEPFSGVPGPAHTFVTFGFGDGEFVGISVELRRERGEHFSPIKGLLRQYELTYVVADERDLIGLRANHRRDSVYLYPVRTTTERMRALFTAMLTRANALAAHPEFYNTLTSTCTTNIVSHINDIAPRRVPLSYKVLLPAFADELAYDIGLLDSELPFEQMRAAHRINQAAAEFADRPDFSVGIRRGLAGGSTGG
ncbi:MAG: DUF4105 domain-containing protein [Gemmatimonadaceae bacterium]|nr:DUF4105 domain-containing protein [Gemmatimonadaceae bacterium]